MSDTPCLVRLQFGSTFRLLDLVQEMSDAVGRQAGLTDDQRYDVGVAIRETVINAIRHGNRQDVMRQVTVEWRGSATEGLSVTVSDEGSGFDPEAIADPLAPENLMKGSGRGLLFMRAYMDEVDISPRPGGGTLVRLYKKPVH
ncbi:MAG: ATP-binding protein [Acidobacteria bacterium]|nr:ATP-binding protein [Acidobacteriota bacterium]